MAWPGASIVTGARVPPVRPAPPSEHDAMGSSPSALDPVVLPHVEGPRILDVACGFGRWGFLCVANSWETQRHQEGRRPFIVGCDGYLPNVELARSNGCYAECIHARFPPLPFADRSFDTVLLLEIVEHLPEAQALELIDAAKRIAKRKVIVSTPNYPAFRGGHETLTGYNELDAHLCYISRRQLKRLGFTVYGSGARHLPRIPRGLLRRLGLLEWYQHRVRHAIGGLAALMPFLGDNVVGVWARPEAGNEDGQPA